MDRNLFVKTGGWARKFAGELLLAVSLVVTLLGVGAALDQPRAEPTPSDREIRAAYEAGRERGHAEMIASTEAAWRAAATEARFACERRGVSQP